MPASNPFFALQARIQALLAAASYFASLQPTQILTEEIGNLEFQVNNAILPIGFGLVVTTAEGKAFDNEFNALLSMEDLNVSIIHNPTTDPGHKTLDALAAAINAIHGQTFQATPPPVLRPFDYLQVTGHQRRMDSPPELHVHELHVTGGLRLL